MSTWTATAAAQQPGEPAAFAEPGSAIRRPSARRPEGDEPAVGRDREAGLQEPVERGSDRDAQPLPLARIPRGIALLPDRRDEQNDEQGLERRMSHLIPLMATILAAGQSAMRVGLPAKSRADRLRAGRRHGLIVVILPSSRPGDLPMHLGDTPAAQRSPSEGRVHWWRELTRYQWFVFIVASLGWLFDTMDQQLFNLARKPAVTRAARRARRATPPRPARSTSTAATPPRSS